MSLRAGAMALALGLACVASAEPHADWGLNAPAPAPPAPPARAAAAARAPLPPAAAVRPWMGISITEVEGDAAAASGPGLTLARVSPGSPAARAGLAAGDVLLAVDGRVLQGAASLKAALAGRAPGDSVELTLVQGGKPRQARLVLAAAPAGGQPERREQALPAAPARPTVVVAAGAPEAPAVALTYLGDATRPSLGMETMDLEPGLAKYFGVPAGEGVLVETVEPGSPAARAGVQAGDVLLRLGDKPIAGGAALAQELRNRASGERVALTVLRQGRRQVLVPVLAPQAVPAWSVAPAPPPGAQPEAISALVQHNAREIARLELLLAAQEEGNEELVAVLRRSAPSTDGLVTDSRVLRERLSALQAETKRLRAQLP